MTVYVYLIGVFWHRNKRTWEISLVKGGKRLVTGSFDDEEAAARAYDAYVSGLSLCISALTQHCHEV
jgi:hypothetical protein